MAHDPTLLTQLTQLITAGELAAALRVLNAQTPFRFTALYQFCDDMLHNHIVIDRQNPAAAPLTDIPVLASYCVYVRQAARPFVTADALTDGRVVDHPKRQEIRAYCGVPIMREDGTLYGSLCHFDIDPVPVTTETVELLEQVADRLRMRNLSARFAPRAASRGNWQG